MKKLTASLIVTATSLSYATNTLAAFKSTDLLNGSTATSKSATDSVDSIGKFFESIGAVLLVLSVVAGLGLAIMGLKKILNDKQKDGESGWSGLKMLVVGAAMSIVGIIITLSNNLLT